jgi:hypothetical protein
MPKKKKKEREKRKCPSCKNTQVQSEPPQALAVTVVVPPELVDSEDEDVVEDEDSEEDVEDEDEDSEEDVEEEDSEEVVDVGTPIGPFSVVMDAAAEVAEA